MKPPKPHPKPHPKTVIRYGVKPSNLGCILVAATDRGICALYLHDSPEEAIGQLQNRFSTTQILSKDLECDRWAAEVAAFVENPQRDLEAPLDLQGTEFQRQVWQAVREIPCGSTLTYLALSERLGNPKAIRACAHACALNEVAIVVPCHRVVGSNGNLTGYRWGIERKRILLQREATLGTHPETEQLTLSLL